MTTIAIHQPNYLPWMGFFDKISKVDNFVIFDDVQLPMGGHSFETRCVISTPTGPLELNIPVEHRGRALIKDTRIVQGRWQSKHLRSIVLNYPPSARLDELAEIYKCKWTMLLDFNLALILLLVKWLNIKSNIMLSSELGIATIGANKILDTVEALGGDTYISGTGAGSRRYVSEQRFSERGIKLLWHNYSGLNLSVIDSLLR